VSSDRRVLDVADSLGLHADEVLPWLDRLVGSDLDRVVVTSIDLDALASAVDPSPHAPPAPDAGGNRGLEDTLAVMWQELLGVTEIAHTDDFFDLGGHSLMAIRLMTRIKRELGVRFDLSALFEAPTVAALAALIRSVRPEIDADLSVDDPAAVADDTRSQAAVRRHLVTISSKGSRRPLYVVHGAGGNVLFLSTLARALGGDRPIHGFQAMGVNDGEIPDRTIEQMASRYVAELRGQAAGPYLLGGYSGGGIVALEMARQLLAAGERVDHVVLFDSVPPGAEEPGRSECWLRLGRRAVTGQADVVLARAKRRAKRSLRRVIPERSERRQERDVQERALGYAGVDTMFVNLFYYFTAAASRYALATYDVDVTILKADDAWPVHADDYYWSNWVTGRVAWLTVPGDHHSMFFPEHAAALANAVRATLDPLDGPATDR
jgi:thioesterase domain-containing protein/acyl carrier protein